MGLPLATEFVYNQPLNLWDVSKVTDMRYMFHACRKFNQPLNAGNGLRHGHGPHVLQCGDLDSDLNGWDVESDQQERSPARLQWSDRRVGRGPGHEHGLLFSANGNDVGGAFNNR